MDDGTDREKGDPDSEPVPGWWPQRIVWLSAGCTLKDVKCCFLFLSVFCLFSSFFLSFFFFSLCPSFLFQLTISLSLLPDCIRIDCSLSKWFYPFFWLIYIYIYLSISSCAVALFCSPDLRMSDTTHLHNHWFIVHLCLPLQLFIPPHFSPCLFIQHVISLIFFSFP